MADNVLGKTGFVVIGGTGGHTVIPKDSPLTRLNYFDGKFLRAPDLKLEQLALLNQVRLANRAGGPGVVYGYDCTLGSGDALNVGAGFAIDPVGRALYLTQAMSIGIAELIEKTRALSVLVLKAQARLTGVSASFADCEIRAEAPPGEVLDPNDLYLITIGHAEAYCGEEDVYGKLCEEACITSTERPYIVEGVVLRAIPLNLSTLLPTSSSVPLTNKHLRSRVASAYFEQERQNGGSLISGEGLTSSAWCLGATARVGNDVPIAVVARAGDSTVFLDAWIARRERMESPPRHYWAGRMAMRPWNVFLAQVLQFQCQLTTCFRDGGTPGGEDPCAEERAVAEKAAEELRVLMQKYEAIAERLAKAEFIESGATTLKQITPMAELAEARILRRDLVAIAGLAPTNRLLIDCGIIELPSGGYLPVDSRSTLTVNDQVRRMMGEGVDLRFCVVRPDYIPHALEEAQHMERISLLEGIDNPANKPRVDVLVPDGHIEKYTPEIQGVGYEMEAYLGEAGLATDRAVRAAYAKGGATEAAARFASMFSRAFRFNLRDTFAAAVAQGDQLQRQQQETSNSVQGAARGEQIESGGYAFHYAARTPEFLRLIAMHFARPVIGKVARKAAAAGNATRVVEEDVAPNKVAEEESRRKNDFWVTMRVDRDPFAMARGESTNIHAEMVWMMSIDVQDQTAYAILEVTQNGTLTLEDVISTGAEPSVRCALNSTGLMNATVVYGEFRETYPSQLHLNERVYVSRVNEGGVRQTLKVRVPAPSMFGDLGTDNVDIDIEFRFQRAWPTAEHAELKSSLWLRAVIPEEYRQASTLQQAAVQEIYETEVTLFTAAQRVSRDVFNPGNAMHDASLEALRRIDNVVDDPRLADIRARQLFPPPEEAPSELRIFAERDWVMFHRRRDISCRYDELPEIGIIPRRYRLFHVNKLSSKEDLARLIAALKNNTADLDRFAPEPAGVVEFEAGLHNLRTPYEAVQADWTTVVGEEGASIMLGAIASRGAAVDEGVNMARLRLDSLADVLDEKTPLQDEAKFRVLKEVPDVLPSGDVDGVIVMATVSAVVCHRVYRLEVSSDDAFKAFYDMIGKDFDGAIEEFGAKQLNKNAQFVDRESTFFGNSKDELIGEWVTAGDRDPWSALLVVRPEGAAAPTVPTDQPYEDQTKAIALAVSVNPDLVQSVAFNAAAGGDACVAATVLAVFPVALGNVYFDAYAKAASTPNSVVKAASESINFDASGALVKDAAFDATVKALKDSGTTLKAVEVVSKDEPAVTTDARAEAMLAAFKAAGVAEEGATVKLRKATSKEVKSMGALGTAVSTGFVLKK